MRSLKSGLVGCVVAGFFGTVAVIGCSASGDTGDIGDPTTANQPTEPSTNGGSVLPPSNNDEGDETAPTGDAGKKDGGGKDAGKTDAGKDAGPPAPEPGAACPTANDIFKRTCGTCGTQEAVCLANEDGGPGGTVSPYGECKNQVQDGCMPGTTEDIACGNCGTMKRTCNQYCAWTGGSCTGQPQNSCTPGSIEFVSAGCDANVYRQRSCKANCTWDNFSQTCSAPPSFVLVPPTAGGVNSTIAILSSTKTIPKLSTGTCPATLSSTATPYSFIEVRNTNPKAVTVSVYNSAAPGGPEIDTIMAAYDGATIPTTDAARKACKGSITDSGNTALTGASSTISFASLDGTKAVTIPANSSVQVYFASYDPYDASNPNETTGMVKLNVKTESVAP